MVKSRERCDLACDGAICRLGSDSVCDWFLSANCFRVLLFSENFGLHDIVSPSMQDSNNAEKLGFIRMSL